VFLSLFVFMVVCVAESASHVYTHAHLFPAVVDGHLLLVSDLVLSGALLPLAFVPDLVPLGASGLGHLGHGHSGFCEARTILLEPQEVGGLGALWGVRVLLSSLNDTFAGCTSGHFARRLVFRSG